MTEQSESNLARIPRRRLWRFIPEMLLALLAALWLLLGILPNSANRQKRAVEAIERNRGRIGYAYQTLPQPNGFLGYRFQREPPGPTLLRWLVGKHYFMTARWVRVGDNGDNCLSRLADLPNIELAIFDGASDSDIENVKHLGNLRYLSLWGYVVSDAGRSPFWVLEHLPNLEQLNLEQAQFGDRDAKYLRNAKNLKCVFFNRAPIGDEGLAFLRDLNNLQFLELAYTKVTDRGLAYLCSLPKLQYLGLTGTDVSDSSFEALSKMTSLRTLGIRETKIDGIGRLRRALPNCKIEH